MSDWNDETEMAGRTTTKGNNLRKMDFRLSAAFTELKAKSCSNGSHRVHAHFQSLIVYKLCADYEPFSGQISVEWHAPMNGYDDDGL